MLYIRGSQDALASGNPENDFKLVAKKFTFEVFNERHIGEKRLAQGTVREVLH